MRITRHVDLGDEDGAAVVEFGLIVLPLMSLILIIVLVGIALNIQMSLTNGAREGVRVLALEGAGADWQTRTTEGTTLNAVGTPTSGRFVGGAEAAGTCTLPADAGKNIDVFVRVEKPFGWALPEFLGGGEFKPKLAGRAVMRCGG